MNFSNWVDVYACDGKWRIEIKVDADTEENLTIYMPTSDWGKPHSGGYIRLNSGKPEIANGQLLLWYDDNNNVSFKYTEIGNQIMIEILNREIVFENE